jgi:hypothetical protein
MKYIHPALQEKSAAIPALKVDGSLVSSDWFKFSGINNGNTYRIIALCWILYIFPLYGFSQVTDECQVSIPVDLSGSPTAEWVSPEIESGPSCCEFPNDYFNTFELVVSLHPDARAFEVEFENESEEIYYIINCDGVSRSVPNNKKLRICVDAQSEPVRLIFSRPGDPNFNLTVKSLRWGIDIEFPPFDDICRNDAPITLSNATPSGGQYFINGSNTPSTVFDPSHYPALEHTILYSYTNTETGCTGTAEETITVIGLPELSCENISFCLGSGSVILSEIAHQLPSGGIFYFNGEIINEFNPTQSGVFPFEFEYTDPGTFCTRQCFFNITVNPLPVPENPTILLCDINGEGVVNNVDLRLHESSISAGPNLSFTFYRDEQFSNLVDQPENVSINDGDSFWVIITNNITSCVNTGRIFFEVDHLPINNHSEAFCDQSSDNSLQIYNLNLNNYNNYIYPTASGVSYAWFTDEELLIPAVLPVPIVNQQDFFVRVTDGSCTASAKLSIIINPLPALDCENLNTTLCHSTEPIILTDYFSQLPSDGIFRLDGNDQTSFDPSNPGIYHFTYEYKNPVTQCSNSCNFTITVASLPQTQHASIPLCDDDESGQIDNVNLTTYESLVTGETGVSFYFYHDEGMTLDVTNPTDVTITDNQTIYVKVENATGCSNSAILTFSLQDLSVPDKTISLCDESDNDSRQVYNLNLSGFNNQVYLTVPGVTYAWYFDDDLSNQVTTNVAVVSHNTPFWVEVTHGSCTEVAKVVFEINTLPVVNCPELEASYCQNAGDISLHTLEVSPPGGIFEGNGVVHGGIFRPSQATVGANTITYTYTDPDTHCINSCSFTINVDNVPNLISSSQTIELCDPSGQKNVNLNDYTSEISQDAGVSFSFYRDISLSNEITTHDNIIVYDGEIIYVKVSNSNCSIRASITFSISNGLVLTDREMDFCDKTDDNGLKLFDVDLNGFNNDFYPFSPDVGYEWFSDAGYENLVTANIPEISHNDKFFSRVTFDGCTEDASLTFHIKPLPELTCNITVEDLCHNAEPFDLTTIAPETGGYFAGPGTDENIFYPSQAGTGNHPLQFFYSDGLGCTASCDFEIEVKPVTQVICPDTLYFCSAGGPRLLNHALPDGGVYFGEGVYLDSGSYYFDADITGAGEFDITYTYSENGCTDTCTIVVDVLELVDFACDGDQVVCEDSGIMNLNALCPQPGTFSGNGVTFNTETGIFEFNPSSVELGDHEIIHIFTHPLSLIDYVCKFKITVVEYPVITFGKTINTFCQINVNEDLEDLFDPDPSGGTFFVNGVET